MFVKIQTMKKYKVAGLKMIPSAGYDFDNVIENMEIILHQLFPDNAENIKAKVYSLSIEYDSKIRGNYWRFIKLANSNARLRDWNASFQKEVRNSTLKHSVLDLYFQMNMVQNWDVYNDILIHAYLEDIQPNLEFISNQPKK